MSSSGAPAVTFDYATWQARYPEFSLVSATLAGLYFSEACLYCHNRLGPVSDVGTLAMLLNMLTAHIAALNAPSTASGASPSTPPGRLSSVSEGSVSAGFTLDMPQQAAFFAQTKYGLAYWQATSIYRTMQYRPGTRRFGGIGGPWLYSNDRSQ